MAKKFSAADLIAAGVAQADKDGVLKPSAALQHVGKPLLFLYFGGGSAPWAVITSVGMLAGRWPPVVTAFRDAITRRAVQSAEQLLIAFTLEDVAILRAADLPATWAFGMERLSRLALTTLCEECGWEWTPPEKPKPGGPAAAPSRGPSAPGSAQASREPGEPSRADDALPLTFVGWSVAELRQAKPVGLKPVLEHLRRVENHLEVEGMEVGVWIPSDAFLERLRFRSHFGGYQMTAEEALENIEDNCVDGMQERALSPPPPPLPKDLAQTMEEYRKVLQNAGMDSSSREALRAAETAFHQQVQDELLVPLLRGGQGAAARNFLALLMEVSGLAHRLVPVIETELAQKRADDFMRGPIPKLKQLDRLVQLAINLTKVIRWADLRRPSLPTQTQQQRNGVPWQAQGGFGPGARA
jgi:hypothetical protein